MSSVSVAELKNILNYYPEDYEVVMSIKHRYPISKEQGEKGWVAYINAINEDDRLRCIELMN